jgi:CO/xanthine dehydrogenase Mo-binding subunit/aerobic-type carbon monoxide dehydrogenase small subunit (CoxS/CutS family)
METEEFCLVVNGAQQTVTCEPNTPLLDVLRHDLGLAGPRFGCGLGLCGACYVLVSGRACSSCDLPVSAVDGPVTTVEGLAADGQLHPVQQAFLDEQAAQCGYCSSGMVMSAAALLRVQPAPSEQDVRRALDGNLCRCGCHGRIVRAVLRAASGPPGPADAHTVSPAGNPAEAAAPAAGGVQASGVWAIGSGISQEEQGPSADRLPSDRSGAADLPANLAANPPLARWLDFGQPGEVTIRTGKVEYGQGIWTALAQIAAEELQVDLARVLVAPVSTSTSPDEGHTSGSRSVQDSGSALRQVCAQARELLITDAATRLSIPPSALTVSDGQAIADGGPTGVSYWSVSASGAVDRLAGHPVPPRPVATWTVAGHSAQRLDLPAKVTGQPRFLHDLRLPGMLYGRVVRPPSLAARLTDLDVVKLGPDESLVHDGSFLGVVAPTDRAALRSAARLARAARWETPGTSAQLPDERDVRAFLLAAPSETETALDRSDPAESTAVTELTAEFTRPFLAHASMAPSCGIACWDGGSVAVWCHSQSIFALRAAIAAGLGLDAGQVTVHHREGAGVYGQNGADDVAMDAVLLARSVPGRPVRVQWTREDEMRWAPAGSAMLARLSAGLDAAGRILTWQQEVWSNGFIGRPATDGEPRLLALTHLTGGQPMRHASDGAPSGAMGATRNAVPGYDIPRVHVTRHRLTEMPIRTSSLRSLGAHLNVLAIESFMDELAAAAGQDPVQFRLAHLSDPRARRVLAEAALMAGWDSRPRTEAGFGVGVARYKGQAGYCAAVAEVAAETDISLRRLWLAVDVGRVINPDGVRNQVEGGAVQSASWTLREQVRFDQAQITSVNWDSYPILRFTDVPTVTVRIIDAPAEPETGAGEVAQGPVAGAIANAVAQAVGVRVRDLPLTRAQIERAIAAS